MDEPRQNAETNTGPPSNAGLKRQEPLPWFAEPSQTILLGSDGLRAGWRLLLYLSARQILLLLLGILIYKAEQTGALDLWLDLLAECMLLVAALLPAIILARLEDRRFGAYGLPWRQAFGKLFWVGAVWGIGAVSLLMVSLHGAGALDFGKLALHGARILKFAAFWGLYFLVVGFAEEFYLRGYTQFTLTLGIGFWPAAAILSIAFAAMHFRNPGETLAGLLGAGLIGFFFCLTLRRTGTLWFAVGFHAAWDWGESYLYSVPDSGTVSHGHLLRSSLHGSAWLTGGSVGPEGSVFLFLLIALLWVAFDRVYPQANYGIPKKLKVGSAS